MADTTLQYELYQNKLAVLQAIQRGAQSVDELPDSNLGPTDFGRVDYPYAQVLPEQTAFESGNEWAHTVRLNLIFQRGKREDDYLTFMAVAFDAVKQAIAELSTVDCVVSYLPQLIEDFAGETNGNLLVMFSVQLRVSTLVDLNDI